MKKLLILAALFIAAQSANAWVTCGDDKITSVVWHNNGEIYFNTAKKCPNDWCMINSTSYDQKKMAYAAMLSAYENDFPVSVLWDNGSGNNEDCTPYAWGVQLSPASYFMLLPK